MDDLSSLAQSVAAPRTKELGEQVLEQLRVLIITRRLQPGTHLVESHLSTTFGVSRGPVRDALTRLEAEGLVESRRRGCYVRGLSTDDIDELYSLREAIEMMALMIASGASAERWSLVDAPLAQMREAAKSGDHLAFAQADMAFHASFYAIAGHTRLQKIWQQYEPTFAVLLTLTTAEDVDLGPSYESHVEIHQQAISGQVDQAIATLREHLVGSRSRLVSSFARMMVEQGFEAEES